MQKFLLLMASFVLTALSCQAQNAETSAPDEFTWIECAPAANASPIFRAEAGENYEPFWWSYCDPTPKKFGGWSSPETICVGIYIPDQWVGYQIDSVRFALGASEGLDNLRIWYHMGLPDNFQDAEVIESVKKSAVDYHEKGEWNTAAFSDPIIVDEPKNKYTKCCIGFAFDQTVSGSLWPLAYTEPDPDFSCWILATKNFSSWGSFASLHGAYAMSVRLSKPNPDAISGLRTQSAEVEAYYTLDGRRHTTMQPGINLVRYTDGSVRQISK